MREPRTHPEHAVLSRSSLPAAVESVAISSELQRHRHEARRLRAQYSHDRALHAALTLDLAIRIVLPHACLGLRGRIAPVRFALKGEESDATRHVDRTQAQHPAFKAARLDGAHAAVAAGVPAADRFQRAPELETGRQVRGDGLCAEGCVKQTKQNKWLVGEVLRTEVPTTPGTQFGLGDPKASAR